MVFDFLKLGQQLFVPYISPYVHMYAKQHPPSVAPHLTHPQPQSRATVAVAVVVVVVVGARNAHPWWTIVTHVYGFGCC